MSRPLGLFGLARGLLVPGNIRLLAVTSMITGAYVSILSTILQVFVVQYLGFSITILGVLVAVGSRPLGVASSIVQPISGHLADLVGRRPLVILGSGVGISAMASFFLAAYYHNLAYLAAAYVLFGLSLLGTPATQATIGESVSMDPARINVAFSVVFFFTQLPGAILPFTAGYIVGAVGYSLVFVAAALLESINLILLVSGLRETRPPHQNSGIPPRRFSLRESISIPRRYLGLFTPFAMDAFFFGLSGSIIYGIWVDHFGLTKDDISLIVGTLSVSVVVFQYAATRLQLRIGTRRILALSEFLTVIVLAGWVLFPVLPAFIIFAAVFGASIATWVPAQTTLLVTAAPVEERGSLSGKLAAFRGLIGAPAPFLGALIFANFGYTVVVGLSAVGEAFTVVALLRLLPRG